MGKRRPGPSLTHLFPILILDFKKRYLPCNYRDTRFTGEMYPGNIFWERREQFGKDVVIYNLEGLVEEEGILRNTTMY